MAGRTEDDLWDMSDAELEAAMKADIADGMTADLDSADDGAEEVDNPEEELDEPDTDNSEDQEEEPEVEAEEDEKEEEKADLEQPDEESDDDGTDKAEEAKGETEDSKDDKSEEENIEEKPAEDDKPVQVEAPVKKIYKANGKEFEFTDKEALEQFGKVFAQSMNYTQKAQAIAPYRKMISAMEDEKVTEADMNLMIDAWKGDKQAIAKVLERTGVDVLDIEPDAAKEYQPKSYGRSESDLAIRDIVAEISHDKEYAITENVIDSQWDDASRQVLSENPVLIKRLHNDVVSGVYDKVSIEALKMKVLDGGQHSDIAYYAKAGEKYIADLNLQQTIARIDAGKAETLEAEQAKIAKVKAEEATRQATAAASTGRKAAVPTKRGTAKKSVVDYLDGSDESFDEWYANLEASQ